MEDIKRKSADLDQVKVFSRDLQNVLNVSLTPPLDYWLKWSPEHLFNPSAFFSQEYEIKSNTYRGTLKDDDSDDDDDDEPLSKKRLTSTMAQAVQRKVQSKRITSWQGW